MYSFCFMNLHQSKNNSLISLYKEIDKYKDNLSYLDILSNTLTKIIKSVRLPAIDFPSQIDKFKSIESYLIKTSKKILNFFLLKLDFLDRSYLEYKTTIRVFFVTNLFLYITLWLKKKEVFERYWKDFLFHWEWSWGLFLLLVDLQ